jgi:hypothetical protein
MSQGALIWHCLGPDPRWCAQLEELLPAIGQALDLAEDFRQITVLADDSPREERCWLRVDRVASEDDPRLVLEVHCSTRSLGRARPLEGPLFPTSNAWANREGVWPGEAFDDQDFSVERANVFLHHNLLLARDLVRGEVSPAAIPSGQVEAFEAAWEVVVDGRLARAGLPGYSLAHRRGKFSKLFSSAGVLMPDHWQIFQSLWDGGLATSRDVLAVIRQLPRLGSTGH